MGSHEDSVELIEAEVTLTVKLGELTSTSKQVRTIRVRKRYPEYDRLDGLVGMTSDAANEAIDSVMDRV